MPGNGERRPADEPSGAMNPGEKFNDTLPLGTDGHGAELAEDAAQAWKVHTLEHAILTAAAEGAPFGADDVQARYDVPDLGNATGGVYRRLHHAGVIRRLGWRPSTKRSRCAGVIAIWTAGENR